MRDWQPVTSNDIVDDVLARYANELGAHAEVYRNHVLRAFNYHLIVDDAAAQSVEAALAWAVHDLGVWTSGWDYIGPSVALARTLAPEFGADADVAAGMVEWHHKLTPARDPRVESFRVADRVDASRGLVKGPVTAGQVAECVAALPYLGFHRLIAAQAAKWALRHPLNPAPMLRR